LYGSDSPEIGWEWEANSLSVCDEQNLNSENERIVKVKYSEI